MYLRDNQKSTIHHHRQKIEDIINIAGGKIAIKFWHKNDDNSLSTREVEVQVDGRRRRFKPGEEIFLDPGESINLPTGIYHQFWAKKNSGQVVSMEVSSVNDDTNDNIWLDKGARYPEIEEDEPRKYILCYEYDRLVG